jgi:hypothetical protein
MIQGTQIRREQQPNRDRAEKTKGSIQTQRWQQPDNQRRSTRRSAGALAHEKETLLDLTGGLTTGKLTGEENRQGPNEPSREQTPGSALQSLPLVIPLRRRFHFPLEVFTPGTPSVRDSVST